MIQTSASEVYRRFSDFEELHKLLLADKSIFLPQLPSKGHRLNKQSLGKERLPQLQHFLD